MPWKKLDPSNISLCFLHRRLFIPSSLRSLAIITATNKMFHQALRVDARFACLPPSNPGSTLLPYFMPAESPSHEAAQDIFSTLPLSTAPISSSLELTKALRIYIIRRLRTNQVRSRIRRLERDVLHSVPWKYDNDPIDDPFEDRRAAYKAEVAKEEQRLAPMKEKVKDRAMDIVQ